MRFDFQFCSERSGSNLMAKVMDGHPEICGPFPSHMIRTFAHNYACYGDLHDNANWQALTGDVADYLANMFAQWESTVTADELRNNCLPRSLGSIVRYVYEKEAEARGKSRVYVKENHAYGFLPFTLANFPNSKFVWVVRDPRDMAQNWRDSILQGGVQNAVKAWKTDQSECIKVHSFLKDAGKILLVRFEELLRDPQTTCQRICAFIDAPYTAQMLDFHKNSNVTKNAGAITAWADLAKPIISSNLNNYQGVLSETEIRYVEASCHREMAVLGYECDYPDSPQADVATLEHALPPQEQFNIPRNKNELERYTPFQEVNQRLHTRWAERISRL